MNLKYKKNLLGITVIFSIFSLVTCVIDNDETVETEVSTSNPTRTNTYKVFIENSGSMFPYLGGTNYYNNFSKLYVLSQKDSSEINIYSFNDTIYEQKGKYPEHFSTLISSKNNSPLKTTGIKHNSDIIKMLQRSIDLVNDSTILFFVSDLIYSTKDANHKIERAPADIEAALVSSNVSDVSFAVFRIISEYDGTYYPGVKQAPIHHVKFNRPYYIIALATENHLNKFLKSIDYGKEFDGFENLFVANKNGYYVKTYIESPNSRDRFGSEIILSNNIDSLSILLDCQDKLLKSLLKDTNNYEVKGAYKIVSIEDVDKNDFSQNEITRFEKRSYTPALRMVLSRNTDNKIKKGSTVSITLKRNIPAWVSNYTSTDDSNIKSEDQREKTYGLKYLIDGFSSVFGSNKEYFTITYNIK